MFELTLLVCLPLFINGQPSCQKWDFEQTFNTEKECNEYAATRNVPAIVALKTNLPKGIPFRYRMDCSRVPTA